MIERAISLKRAVELIEEVEGCQVTKGKVISYEKILKKAIILYEILYKNNETTSTSQLEEVYVEIYRLYKNKNRLLMNLGKEKKDIQYLKSDEFEEDLLQLSKKFRVEEEYNEFVDIEMYLREQRSTYIEKGVVEHYPVVQLSMNLISKNPLIKEKSKDKDLKVVIKEESGVAVEDKIIELLKTDYSTIFVNKSSPRIDFTLSLKNLSPKKAVVYSLRLHRYEILKEEEVEFRNNFFERMGKDERAIEKIKEGIENLDKLEDKSLLFIIRELMDEELFYEHEVLAKYEEVRVAFNETYEEFKEKFSWMLELFPGEEALRMVYIHFLIYKKEFYRSPSKKIQYKSLLKKLVKGKNVTPREKEYVLEDFFSAVLLYLDQDLEKVMTRIRNNSHELVLSYLNLVLEGIEKWDLYEERFGERRLAKIKIKRKKEIDDSKKLTERLTEEQKIKIMEEMKGIRVEERTRKISEMVSKFEEENSYEYVNENQLMLIILKSMTKPRFELDKYLF